MECEPRSAQLCQAEPSAAGFSPGTTKCKHTFLACDPPAHLHLVGTLRFMSSTFINRACPLLFIPFLCLFLSLWPFLLYFIPYSALGCSDNVHLSRQLAAFSLCSSGLTSALLVLSTVYLCMKVSLSPDIILGG